MPLRVPVRRPPAGHTLGDAGEVLHTAATAWSQCGGGKGGRGGRGGRGGDTLPTLATYGADEDVVERRAVVRSAVFAVPSPGVSIVVSSSSAAAATVASVPPTALLTLDTCGGGISHCLPSSTSTSTAAASTFPLLVLKCRHVRVRRRRATAFSCRAAPCARASILELLFTFLPTAPPFRTKAAATAAAATAATAATAIAATTAAATAAAALK